MPICNLAASLLIARVCDLLLWQRQFRNSVKRAQWFTYLPEALHRDWGSSAAASKQADLRVWGPRSGPTQPRLFDPKASLRGGPEVEYCRWSPEGPAAVEPQTLCGASGRPGA